MSELTAREAEVLALVASGHGNPDIARILHISLDTAKANVRSATRKLGARNRTHAAVLAALAGSIPAPTAAPPRPVPPISLVRNGRTYRLVESGRPSRWAP